MTKRTQSSPAQTKGASLLNRTPPAKAKTEATALTPMNFKVSPEFHRDFKMFAAQHSKTMVEVLQEAFALLKESHGR